MPDSALGDEPNKVARIYVQVLATMAWAQADDAMRLQVFEFLASYGWRRVDADSADNDYVRHEDWALGVRAAVALALLASGTKAPVTA
jgi:hypothetical protein